MLGDLTRKSTDAKTLAARYLNQTSHLHQSSSPVIVQVNTAIERSVHLGEAVQSVVSNGTQQLQESQNALTAAQMAVERASRVHGNAQKMLEIASNFETESRRAQTSANNSLRTVASARNKAHRIIMNVSVVNESSAHSLSLAKEALRLGIILKNLSVFEKQVWMDLVNVFICNCVVNFALFRRDPPTHRPGDIICSRMVMPYGTLVTALLPRVP